MKNALYIALIATTTILSVSVQAIPPNPPTPAKDEPAVIVCKNISTLSEKESDELNANSDKIIAIDRALDQVCFEK